MNRPSSSAGSQVSTKRKIASHFHSLWIWFAALLFSLATPAQGSVSVDLRLYSYGEGFFAFPLLRTNNLPPSAAGNAYFAYSESSTPTNGIHYELYPDGRTGGGSVTYTAPENFFNEINGPWTLLVTNATQTNVYTFNVDLGESGGELQPVFINFPTDGQTISQPRPTFTWDGLPGWQGSLDVSVHDSDYSYYLGDNLDPFVTSWVPPNALPFGELFFRVEFGSNVTDRATITTPTNASGHELEGWLSELTTRTYREVSFTHESSSSGTIGGHTNLAHYTFEDEEVFTEDVSGNENHISSTSGYGCGDLTIIQDATAGNYALNFDTEDGSCPVWLGPNENLKDVMADSFTVSVWLRTTRRFSENFDTVDGAAGVISGYNGDLDRAVLPIGILDDRVIFFTSGSNYDVLTSPTSVDTGEYIHVAVTRNRLTGEKKIYINGVLDAFSTGSTGLLNGFDEIEIGHSNGNGFDGDLDDIQFYSGVLSASEITFIYNNPGSTVADQRGVPVGGHRNIAQYSFDNSNRLGQDDSGNGNDIDCSATWGTPVHSYNATSLAGSGAILFEGRSAFCVLTNSQAFTNWSATLGESFTFSAWVNTTNSKGNPFNNAFFGAPIFWAYNERGNINDTIPISLTGGFVAFTTRGGNGANETLHSTRPVNDGNYHHIVVTRDQSTGEKRIYIDGQLDASASGTTDPLNGNAHYYSIGGSSFQIDSTGTNFSSYIGLLDEAQIYQGVLSPSEIETLYNDPGTIIPDMESVSTALGVALNAPYLQWFTGGDAPWFPQSEVSHDGVSAAQSGIIEVNENSWIETTVTGPGTISFWWRLSSEFCSDFLYVTLDDSQENSLYGCSDWEQNAFYIPPGQHIVRWTYLRDIGIASDGMTAQGVTVPNAAYLDQVVMSEETAPIITDTSGNVRAFTGTNVTLLVTLTGNPPPDLRWYRNNILIPGQTNSTLRITNAQTSDSGFYYLVASNHLGSAQSLSMQVSIVNPADLRPIELNGPLIVGSQTRTPFTWTVTNTGPGTISNSFLEYLIVSNELTSVVSMTRRQNPPIAPGSYTWTNTGRFAYIGAGDYTLTLQLDVFDSVLETNESNNSISIPVTVINPDIQPGNLRVAPSGIGGQNTTVIYNITNNGPAFIDGASWNDRISVSVDGELLGSSTVSSPSRNPNIGVGQVVTFTNVVQLPVVTSGNYFLSVHLDGFGFADHGNLWETSETNNAITVPIQITVPDQVPNRLSFQPEASTRQPIQLEWSVTNMGDGVASNRFSASYEWSDRFYLSTNQSITSSSIFLGRFSGNSYLAQDFRWPTVLEPGATITNLQTINIPNVAEGDYFIVLLTDNLGNIPESNETNNTLAMPIRVANPDLVPVTLIAPATADAQSTIPVVMQTQNQGLGNAYPTWFDRFYLSTNSTFDTNDVLLLEATRTQIVGSTSNYLTTNVVSIPGVAAGNYFLIARLDARVNLFETTTTNNFISTPINLSSPDLAVSAMNAPVSVASQQPINLTFVVTNVGGSLARPSWTDRLFLSTDSTLDATDLLIGRLNNGNPDFNHTSDLPVSGSYTQEVDIRIPAVIAGNYFLIAQTDALGSFAELNEGNNAFAHALQVFNPDLMPTNLLAQTSVTITQLNQRIEVGWNVLNKGAGAALSGWADHLYLSRTNVFDTNAVLLSTESGMVPLAPGESYLSFKDPVVRNGSQGSYYLLLLADGGSDLFESNETNNLIVSPLEVIIPPLPDLQVVSAHGPVEALSGQEIEIRWVLTNAGTAAVSRPFREAVYLSTGSDGAGATHYGTFEATGVLAAGDSVERRQRITLPLSLSGQRWVHIVTDVHNEIFEFNRETNNTQVSTEPIRIILSPTPNLEVVYVTSPSNAFSGQQALIEFAVTNSGTGPTRSPYWYEALYLSTDTVLGNDTFLGTVANASYLNPGESYNSSRTITFPRGVQGTHYILIVADSGKQVFENADESDNLRVSDPFFITLTAPPDLRVDSLVAPRNAFSGQSMPVSWVVTNSGLGQTLESSWWDRVYFSTNTTLESGDPLLGTFRHNGALEPDQVYRVTNDVALPVGISGEWYVIVETDTFNNVYEVPFESNNRLTANSATLVALTPPPDLETTILKAPTNATSSRALSVAYRVINNGATATPTSYWVDRLYLSEDKLLDSSDTSLTAVAHYGALFVGDSYTNTISVTLPDTLTRTNYLIVLTDSEQHVFELDRTNNAATSDRQVEITSQPADLIATSLIAPATVEAGSAMVVTWAITNIGTGDTAVFRWHDLLTLSSDDFLGDGDDLNLAHVRHDGLIAARDGYSVSNLVVSIPIGVLPGTYRLFLRTDWNREVYETAETNNLFGPVLVEVTRATADLQITEVSTPPSAVSGNHFTVRWLVQNFGARAPNSGYWVDAVYLSTDPILSPADLFLGSRQNATQLQPGEHYTNSLSVTLPQNLNSNYFVIVQTDSNSRVVEAGLEGNNTFIKTPPVSITLSPVPDLEVTVDAPTNGFSGQTFKLTWAVTNIGTDKAEGIWYDAVYLSLDHFLDPSSDVYLGFVTRPTNLVAGDSYTRTHDFEIPAGLAGPYFVFVATDVSDRIFERGNDNNNIAFDEDALNVTLTPPVDLVAGQITIPANASPGVKASITYVIHNFGSNVARGSWEDAIYISSDTNFDAGDSLMGRVRHTGDLPPNASYTNNLTAPLPGILPGDYHVIVRSDIRNHIPESDETNNLGATLDSVAVDVEILALGSEQTGTIDQGQSVFYRFDAVAGTTVRIQFTTGVPLSGSELFVRRGQMPTRGTFDFAVNEPFVTNPDLLIPIEQTGTYYLLAYASALPQPATYKILAEVLPFSLIDSHPRVAGDQGVTTLKVRGALFEPNSVFQLVKDTNVITAASLFLEDSTTAYVTFNLVGVTNGTWNLRAIMNETSIVSSIYSNALTVTSGGGPEIAFGIDGPLAVWAIFTQRLLVFYGNNGNSDAESPLILLDGRDGTAVGSEIGRLTTNALQLLGRSTDGPADILRPQSSYSHAVYYRGGGLHVRGTTIETSDLHPITDDEWLAIERSVRPFGVDDSTWVRFWAGIRPRIGPTWGEYVTFLNRLAAPLPAEQRAVRQIFGHYITNEPTFIASSIVSGTLRNSTDDSPIAGVEIAFYANKTNGAIAFVGSAVTDAGGGYLIPFIPAGQYTVSIDDATDLSFDQDRDGREDVGPPTFVVSGTNDINGQIIYALQPLPDHPFPNDSDAKLAVDALGVLHAFWFRDDQLWHARNSAGNWINAAPITTNKVVAFTVGSSDDLVDGSAPGLILVWSQSNFDSVDLMYSVGQAGPDGYFWSQPIRLTDDLVENASPSVIVRDGGVALVTYLKRGVRMRDDTDLYFAAINVVSGKLLSNAWMSDGPVMDLERQSKQTFGWAKELKLNPLGVKLTLGIEAAGELTVNDCDAGATVKLEASAQVDSGDYFFKGAVAGEGSLKFNVDPDECDWQYLPDASSANLHVSATLGANNVAFRILAAYPPTTAFVNAMEEFILGFAEYCGFTLENTLEFKVTGSLLGAHWEEAPLVSFGRPTFNSAEASIGGGVKFVAKHVYGNDIRFLDDGSGNLLTDNAEPKPNFTLEAGLEIVAKAQIYPEWKPQTLTLTPSLTLLTPGGWKIPIPSALTTPLELNLSGDPARPISYTNLFDLDAKMIFVPATAIGTGNVYGSNSVVANVAGDVLNDGAPSLTEDANGVPYQIWYREVDPYSGRYGSDLFMSEFDGANWSVPAVIPNTGGINSAVNAATDLFGRRMAIWVHGDATVTTNTSLGDFLNDRRDVEVHFATYQNGVWTVPQPIVITEGADGNLEVSITPNGDVLAVWTHTDTNAVAHLVSSRWNGSSWSPVAEISAGDIRTPTARQVGGTTYLLWTVTDRSETTAEVSLFQSVHDGSSWSSPTAFAPQLASAPKPAKRSAQEVVLARNIPGNLVFGEIPDKCCKCKGRSTSATNNPPTECGVSFVRYDYDNCKKIYEYKACALVSMDPNDIVGPAGFGPERFIGVTEPINYVIHFENDAVLATAPAKEVLITLPLDDDIDPRTFRLGNFGFGDLSIEVPPGRAFYSTRLDLTETRGYILDFFAGVDVAKREAFWRLTTIDPATSDLPINPLLGFLPPNANKPEGEGFVAFSVRSDTDVANGTRIDAAATIVFDTQPPIDTPPIFNSIETGIPSSSFVALPERTNTSTFTLAWEGTDGVGGSGVAKYDIYAAQDGGQFFPILEGTLLTSTPFVGEYGSHYAFYSVAHDNAGNVEPAPSSPDAQIIIATPNSAPNIASLTDTQIVEQTLFTRTVAASDPDLPANAIVFELLGAPTGMTINATNGVITWTPAEDQGLGTNEVVIKVTDDGLPPLSATNRFAITVLETNAAPVFVGPVLFFVDESEPLTITNRVADSDIPNNALTVELISAPTDALFDSASLVLSWTPDETQGNTTNVFILRVTDNGNPALSALRTNLIVVREANSAPMLTTATNRVVLPQMVVTEDFDAADSDNPTNELEFSLTSDAPAGASIQPDTGIFRWIPSYADAGTSKVIQVVVTDNGEPALSATQQFVVVVSDYVRVELGTAVLLAGQTGSVPIQAESSARWETLRFALDLPEGVLGQLALSNSGAADIATLSTNQAQVSITFSNATANALEGSQHLGHMTFEAVSARSISLLLLPENLEANRTNGIPIEATVPVPGRIIIISQQPLLDALKPSGEQQFLTLYGNPGMTYQLDTATNLTSPIEWQFHSEITLTNVAQRVEGVINPPPNVFYRVRQP